MDTNALSTIHSHFAIHELPSGFYGPRFSVWDYRRVVRGSQPLGGEIRVQVGTLQPSQAQAERLLKQAEKVTA